MPNSIARPIEALGMWPMTREAWDRLVDEIARLREDVSGMAGQGLEEGILRLPVAIAARRLETLKGVLDRCELVDEPRRVAIGRRATLRGDDGQPMSFEVGFPGDGDPDGGWVSADSPLGAAILGARPGDVVDVAAPAGRWSAVVVAVE